MKIRFFFYLICFLSHINSFAQRESSILKVDSIKKKYLNKKSIDTLSIARAHYSLGEIFRRELSLTDSAYYHYFKAEKIYRAKKYNYGIASVLYGIASIQRNEKDFLSSEVNSIEAISLLEKVRQTERVKERKSFLYNNLGIVFNELEEYDESINYHKIALEIKRSLKNIDKSKIDNSLNNLGFVYKNIGKYELAKVHYNEILENKALIHQRPDFYALVLNNYAHTLYLSKKKGYKQLPGLYFKALKVTDSVNPGGYNSIIIHQHLAEYYNNNGNKDSAKYYSYKAKDISEKYHNDDLLKSLKLLSEIETGDTSANFLKEYIKLSDSLQKEERKVRNKFARIRFETEQLEEENIKIAKERMWLLIVSTVLIMAFFLLYLVIRQRIKNKELEFVQKQQETNEEIYNLMLSQSDTIEEARTLEKKRISEELHDGVLGRLFGTRLSLDSLNFNNTPEAVKTRGEYIDSLKNIEEDIRKVSHELNTDFIAGAGFRDIIKTLVETQSSAYKLKHSLDHDDSINWDLFSNKTKIHIYRIIQESLHNIYKHAKASSVNIGFKPKNNVICLQVQDNGVGFDVNKAKSGIGLKNMKSRINEINGEFNLSSSKQEGTIVSIEIPLA